MATFIKNSDSVGIDSILAKPLSKGSVKLVDYVVDETNMKIAIMFFLWKCILIQKQL